MLNLPVSTHITKPIMTNNLSDYSDDNSKTNFNLHCHGYRGKNVKQISLRLLLQM